MYFPQFSFFLLELLMCYPERSKVSQLVQLTIGDPDMIRTCSFLTPNQKAACSNGERQQLFLPVPERDLC